MVYFGVEEGPPAIKLAVSRMLAPALARDREPSGTNVIPSLPTTYKGWVPCLTVFQDPKGHTAVLTFRRADYSRAPGTTVRVTGAPARSITISVGWPTFRVLRTAT